MGPWEIEEREGRMQVSELYDDGRDAVSVRWDFMSVLLANGV